MSTALAIAALRDAYPRQTFPDRSVALYARMLADIPDEELTRAVHRLILRSEWMPSIAEIRREWAEEQCSLPTPEEAWQLALARGGPRDERYETPPEVDAAMRDVGGIWQVLHSGNGERTRASFMAAYATRREQTLRTLMKANAPKRKLKRLPAGSRKELPESTRIRPRPLLLRLTARWAGRHLTPPTEEERHDAIRVLEEGPVNGYDDPLYLEAERVFGEASSDGSS